MDNTQVERDNPYRGSRQERNLDLGSDRDRHCVMVMTLMTLIYWLIISTGGTSLLHRLSYCFNLTRRTRRGRRTRSPVPMRFFNS